MKEFKCYLISLFKKQTVQSLVENEMLDAKKAYILSEKVRLYQQAMSQYLSHYQQLLEEQDEHSR